MKILGTKSILFLLTLLMWCTGSQFQLAYAQPIAVCQNVTVPLNPNGIGVLTPSDIDGGSTSAVGIQSLMLSYAGTLHSAYTFTCADAGQTFSFQLVVTDTNGLSSTCTAAVIVQSSAACTNNFQLVLSTPVDASNCTTCDGAVSILGIYDPATGNQAVGPYTYIWSDGSTALQRNDLCPNTPYTVSATDGLGNSYTQTIIVGCNGGGTGSPNAVCQSALTVSLTPNGVYTLTPSQVDGGSTGGQLYFIDGNNYVNSITFNCTHVNSTLANTVTLAVVDSAGVVSTCQSQVYVLDNSGICGGAGTAPVANCVSALSLDLGNANGAVVVTPQMLDNNSSNAQSMWIMYNGAVHSAYTFTCNQLGTHTLTLVVSNANNPTGGGQTSTCTVVVTITDTTNVCGGGSSSYTVNGSAVTPSGCLASACVGAYTFQSVSLSNGTTAPAPYTVVWSDGATGSSRNNLCGGTTYTLTIYDALQNVYTHSIYVAFNCGGNPTTCIDTSLINPNTACPAVYQPVCGCDGVTYGNACEAEFFYGVTSWTTGPCGSTGGGNNNITLSVTGSDCDTANCTGTAVIHIANATPNNIFAITWSDGFSQTASGTASSGATITRSGLCTGLYIASIIDNTTGASYTVTVLVGTAQGCVWPGDADDNTTVNNWDLLPIALAYGESGAARANASINWMGQTATDWTTVSPIAGLPNYKHIDCNGDGLIDQNDLTAVQNNYGQSYYRSNGLAGNIPFYVQSTAVNEGERISLPIHLGSATDIAADVYGVAFTINYDTEMVDAGSVDVDFLNTWLGSNLMEIQYDFSQNGQIEVAVSRKDRLNITGYGQIGSLNLTIRDDILRSATSRNMDLEITNIRLIRNNNVELGTNPQTGTVTINLVSAVEATSHDFMVSVFPNPAQALLNVRTDNAELEVIQLYNLTGQLVYQANALNGVLHSISLDEMAQGIYILQVTTDKGLQTHRVVVTK